MLERLLGRNGGKLLNRLLPEWPAGGCQPDGLHLGVRAHAQALMDRVVFAVDGQNRHIAFARRGGQNLAGRNHALLVGQSERFAGQNRRVRRLQTGHANNRRNHKIGLGQRRAGNGSSSSVNHFDAG